MIRLDRWSIGRSMLCGALALLASEVRAADGPSPSPRVPESSSGWRFVIELPLRSTGASPWDDFILPPAVFDGSRLDLGDLRLIGIEGAEVPYALRVRRPDSRIEELKAREFNRSVGTDGVRELALDLGESGVEHNEVVLELPGIGFRRPARLAGSPDGQDWRELARKDLIRFRVEDHQLEDRRLSYPPSRFRYLRLRVERDPSVDEHPVAIGSVTVRHRVEVPGEWLVRPARLGPREPVRTDEGPGSAWIADLGGENIPCQRLTLDVDDPEFARNYRIEAGGPAGSDQPFAVVNSGLWRRRAGEPRRPMEADFGEVTAARLRIVVIDHSNPPLDVRSSEFAAAARQVVFARPRSAVGAYRLLSGNPKAAPPEYDFARNLPDRLEPPPVRLTLGPRVANPVYRPEPLPLTERWPWLIYVVLGAIAAVLAGLLVSLARVALARHEATALMALAPADQGHPG